MLLSNCCSLIPNEPETKNGYSHAQLKGRRGVAVSGGDAGDDASRRG